MTRKKTHEEYEQELFEREIDYWPIERYIDSKTKILHECIEGHQWLITPPNILNGNGCPQCSSNRKKTHEEYEAELLSKNIVCKPLEPYINEGRKILHQCLEGHQWEGIPNNVLRGRGCPTCFSIKRTKTHEEYEEELKSKSIPYKPIEPYIKDATKILHECIEGHQWAASPTNILRGRGCPECASSGFKGSLPAILYYIKIENFPESFYKIGITNNSILKRFSKDGDKTIRVLLEKHFDKGSDAAKEEKEILEKYKAFRQKIPGFLNSGGNTELFEEDILGLDT